MQPFPRQPAPRIASSLAAASVAWLVLARTVAAQVEPVFPLRIYPAPASGALADPPLFVDFDGDGRDDVIGSWTLGSTTPVVAWSRALPSVAFAPPQPLVSTSGAAIPGGALALLDADVDGDLDLYARVAGAPHVDVWRNDGAAAYTLLASVDIPASSVAWAGVARLDPDPWPDLVVRAATFALPAPWTVALYVCRGAPGGALGAPVKLAALGAEDSGALTRLVDVDGQLGLDVLVAPALGAPLAFLSDGNGNLGAAIAVAGPAGAAEAFDANADGRADLLVDPDGPGPQRLSLCVGAYPAAFGAPIPLPAAPSSPFVQVLDANGDAYPDLLYATPASGSASTLAFYYGSASARFQPSAALPDFASLAHFDDFDGDGARELVAFTSAGFGALPGELGTLAPFELLLAAPPSDADVEAADVDSDGRGDVVFARLDTQHELQVVLGAAGGGFSALAPGVLTNVRDFALADANGDGRADVVGTSRALRRIAWYAGAGDGTFAPAVLSGQTLLEPTFLDVADYDGDGLVDACVAASDLALAHGLGDGTFQTALVLPGSIQNARPARAADFDGDGFLDPYASAGFGAAAPCVQLWLSNGAGGYAAPQLVPGCKLLSRVVGGDFDGDGRADFARVVSDTDVELRYGDGAGSFALAQTVTVAKNAALSCAADLDLDGRDDLVCGSTAAGPGAAPRLVRGAPVGFAPLVETYVATSGDDAAVVDADGDGRLELVTDTSARVANTLSLASGLAAYGAGTSGCQGAQALTGSRAPNVGASDFRVVCHGAPPQALGLGLIGVAPDAGSDPLGIGLVVHVGLGASCVPFYVASSVSGSASRALPIPSDPQLAGATLYAQLAWPWKSSASCDPSPLGLSSTSGLALAIQP